MFSPERLSFNSTMYEMSIVPEHWPGGGGFSVTQLSLNCFYDMHNRCRNWWTGSNVELPLCRYKGTYFKLYQCNSLDYVVRFQTQLPSNSGKLTYPSCQPHMMLMSENKVIVPSKQNEKRKKPYKKIFIQTPPQLTNKWYFQTDLYKTPIVTIHCAACSLDHTFLKPNKISDNIEFWTLNTNTIQNREMGLQTQMPYWNKYLGTQKSYLYFYDGNLSLSTPDNFVVKDLIPLANTVENTPGYSYNHHTQQGILPNNFNDYKKNYEKYWGNPFFHEHLQYPDNYFYSTTSPISIKNNQKFTETSTWKELFDTNSIALTQLSEPLFYKLQYNPNRDTGLHTQVYLLSNKSGNGWDPPSSEDIILEGFPLWLILWGYTDFQVKLKKYTNIDQNCILVVKSNFTQRPMALPFVPIDYDYIQGKSPYSDKCEPQDLTKWYIQQQYQTRAVNQIVSTGPSVPYIENELQENVTIFYKSKWEWGGSPPKSVNIENPSNQIVYPIPTDFNETTSLQNPAYPPENLLYSFDQRHGIFTTKAIERIKKDWCPTNIVTSIADSTVRQQLREAFTDLQTSEEKEHQAEEEILLQLHQLKHQQQCLRQHIMSLLETHSK